MTLEPVNTMKHLRNVAESADAALAAVRDLSEQGVNAPRRVFAGARALLPWPPPPVHRRQALAFHPWEASWSASFVQPEEPMERNWLVGR